MKTENQIAADEAAFLESLAADPAWGAAGRIGNRFGGMGMAPLFDRLVREAKTLDLSTVDQARAKTAGALAALDALRSKLTNT